MQSDKLHDLEMLRDLTYLAVGGGILLLVEMSCSHFKWQFNDFVCGNVNLSFNNYEFWHIFIVMLGMMIGLLLSSWRRFFVSGMMIFEYSLVMAEGCQRKN